MGGRWGILTWVDLLAGNSGVAYVVAATTRWFACPKNMCHKTPAVRGHSHPPLLHHFAAASSPPWLAAQRQAV